jgi:hypothetical protein
MAKYRAAAYVEGVFKKNYREDSIYRHETLIGYWVIPKLSVRIQKFCFSATLGMGQGTVVIKKQYKNPIE